MRAGDNICMYVEIRKSTLAVVYTGVRCILFARAKNNAFCSVYLPEEWVTAIFLSQGERFAFVP